MCRTTCRKVACCRRQAACRGAGRAAAGRLSVAAATPAAGKRNSSTERAACRSERATAAIAGQGCRRRTARNDNAPGQPKNVPQTPATLQPG